MGLPKRSVPLALLLCLSCVLGLADEEHMTKV